MWYSSGGGYTCDECRELYEEDDEEPPCQDCKKPFLLDENVAAWQLWQKLNEFDRQYGAMGGVFKVSTQSAIKICEAYDESLDTFEKILIVERIMYPTLVKQMEAATKRETAK